MAKLYWRVKLATTPEGRGGYWTWSPVVCRFEDGICMLLGDHDCVIDLTYQEEEE